MKQQTRGRAQKHERHDPTSLQKTVILGAGLAGLSCARVLGHEALVLEREAEVGGLARSFVRRGFCFDMAGHWLHVADAERLSGLQQLMDGILACHRRRAAVYANGITTAYPYQVHTYGRPKELIADVLVEYFRARERALRGEQPPLRTFDDYICHHLGEGFARHFMRPYNTKLWTVPPVEMDGAWCSRFVPIPSADDVLLGALLAHDAHAPVGYNATYWYPRQGGIVQLPRRIHREVSSDIRVNTTVTQVDWREHLVTLANGETAPYRKLVSTLPLVELVALLARPPQAVADAAGKLRAASVTYWDIGFCEPNQPNDAHWTYYPDADLPFYRVGSPSAVEPSLAPAGHRSLYVEVSHRHGTKVGANDVEILKGLRKVGLVGAHEEPTVWQHTTIDYAYVILDHEHPIARATILDWLQQNDILSTGRYGGWTYDSMDGAITQGEAAAKWAQTASS